MSLFVPNPITHSIFSPPTPAPSSPATYAETFIPHFPTHHSQGQRTHKEGFVREVGFRARGGGPASKARHSSRSQEQPGGRVKPEVGNSNTPSGVWREQREPRGRGSSEGTGGQRQVSGSRTEWQLPERQSPASTSNRDTA